MRLYVRLAFVLYGLMLSAYAFGSTYVYYNCADQQPGVPLVRCGEITIDETLSQVTIIDQGTNTSDPTEDPDFLFVASPLLPVAVPRHDYEKSDQWEFRGVSFKKTRKDFSLVLLNESIKVDVISAAERGKVFMLFWYSRASGVQAIGFTGTTQSGTVYYCSRAPCLFSK